MAALFGSTTTPPTERWTTRVRPSTSYTHCWNASGTAGVGTFAELLDYLPRATPAQRAKRRLADPIPARPACISSADPPKRCCMSAPLSTCAAGSSPTSPATRARGIAEMVALATHVDRVVCAHDLEAGVRELRLLAAHNPAYNRRSTQPRRGWWICLTEERFPDSRCGANLCRNRSAQWVDRVDRTRLATQHRADGRAGADARDGLRSCTGRLGIPR